MQDSKRGSDVSGHLFVCVVGAGCCCFSRFLGRLFVLFCLLQCAFVVVVVVVVIEVCGFDG